MSKKYDLLGVGNAVVDLISHANDAVLGALKIEKGIMQLVNEKRSKALYAAMSDPVQAPGGSVANTVYGVGALGLSTGFIGRVKDDKLGRFYKSSMEAAGTDFISMPLPGGTLETSRCMIFVSPDGERSMNTYLGISTELGSPDIPREACARSKILFLEGYLFDKSTGKTAFSEAAREVRAAGGIAGMTLSDPFCVKRHREDFLQFIEHELDFIIGNEAEIKALFETNDFEHALACAGEICALVACTRAGAGASAMRGNHRVDVPVKPKVPTDTTGAGDQFAAGFIYGLATGRDLQTCVQMGNLCAGEVIKHVGPRPVKDMKIILRKNGLI